MKHKGYEVRVKSEEELQEYFEELEDEDKTISCWIPSDAGKVSFS